MTKLLDADIYKPVKQLAELTAKLDGDCCTEGCIKCDARKVLAETQEPVAYQPTSQEQSVMHQAMIRSSKLVHKATPPSREWQSLSDEEIGRLAVFDGLHHVEIPLLAKFIIAIEQALKEKNG